MAWSKGSLPGRNLDEMMQIDAAIRKSKKVHFSIPGFSCLPWMSYDVVFGSREKLSQLWARGRPVTLEDADFCQDVDGQDHHFGDLLHVDPQVEIRNAS